MERILKESKSINKNKPSPDFYEEISLLTYLAGLTQEEIITNEIEAASNIMHCALKNLYDDHYTFIQNVLDGDNPYVILTEKSSGEDFKIRIRDMWLFRIILINSIKHSDVVNGNLNGARHGFLISVIEHIVESVDLVKPLSLHLLRTLLLIVTKQKGILSSKLSRALLNHTNRVALSPFTVFRQYAREISKAVVPFLSDEDPVLLDVSLLPIRGVDTCDIVKRFPKTFVRENRQDIIEKVLGMFLRNVESKNGGALYECLLSYSFEDWKRNVWPPFLECLRRIDYEGEFFQSLLKYWITANVRAYKNDFYNFLRNEAIGWKLKGYVLLESKRRGCLFEDDIVRSDISTLYHDPETRRLALKLATTHHKKSTWPAAYEIDVVRSYLYSNTNVSLDEEETRALRCFFSQIFLHAHDELKTGGENFPRYVSTVEIFYGYCRNCLKTDLFEVGAEISFLLWTVATGCHKDLLLNYRLERRDSYGRGENLFYSTLKENDMWWFESETFRREAFNCFRGNDGSSTYLSRLFTTYLDAAPFFHVADLRKVVVEGGSRASSDTEKAIKNYSEIAFRNPKRADLEFVEEVNDFVIDSSAAPQGNHYTEEIVFRIVLYLEVTMVALKYKKYDVGRLHVLIEKCLSVIENIIIYRKSCDGDYKTTKILEAFINKVMLCTMENANVLWESVDKEKVVNCLMAIIQRGNMKRPLSLSVEVLKRLASKMNETESDRNYKIRFLDGVLESLCRNAADSQLRIRRSPDSRLVIHAVCTSDPDPNRPLLKWVLTRLLEVASDPDTADSALASVLHSMEILISDSGLQCPTLPFVPDIIVRCVELFARPGWNVRNADLQLARAIIDRFYGVCLDVCDRPKCAEDLFVLFPHLSAYFYEVLSSDELDERAALVFQFFSESQTKRHIRATDFSMESFRTLFMGLLQKYPDRYGKMAARSYSALCPPEEVPKEICGVVRFLKTNFGFVGANIVSNFVLLIRQLYEKYKNSFRRCVRKEEINVITFAVNDLLELLGHCESQFFDFILLKVKPSSAVLEEFSRNCGGRDFRARLWMHNNVPFLLINAEPKEIVGILDGILREDLPSCVQVKILTVLISKFERDGFDDDTCQGILEIMFKKSLSLEDTYNYLLNCYFKTILVFYQHRRFDTGNTFVKFKATRNVYKLMISVLYFSGQMKRLGPIDRRSFYESAERGYVKSVWFSEETKNDIISTLGYLQRGAPARFKLPMFKLVFYFSLFASTHVGAHQCIISITGRKYSDILGALKDFCSVRNLEEHLVDGRLVNRFLHEVAVYVSGHFRSVLSDGYYSEESDILVPRSFLEKILPEEIRGYFSHDYNIAIK